MVRIFVDGVARFALLRPGEDPRAAAESFCRQYGVTDGDYVNALENTLRALASQPPQPPPQPNPQIPPQKTSREESLGQQSRQPPPPLQKSQIEAEKTLEALDSGRLPSRGPPPQQLPPQRSQPHPMPNIPQQILQQEQERQTGVAGGPGGGAAAGGKGKGEEAKGKGGGEAENVASSGKTIEDAARALKGKRVRLGENNGEYLVFLCAIYVHHIIPVVVKHQDSWTTAVVWISYY